MRFSIFLSTRIFQPISHRVAARPKSQITVACLLLTVSIGFVDYLAGRDITLAFIYAVPISISAWFVGRTISLLLALLSVALWIGGDIATGLYSSPLTTIVNCVVRLSFYSLLGVTLVRFGRLQRGLERRAEYRARALAKETAERERLEQEMIDISEREQRRIGRDLHDGLCQHLTGTALAGHALAETLSSAGRGEAAGVQKIVDLVEEAIELARGMAKGLHPVEMEAGGLMQALEEFAATTSDIYGVRCRFLCHVPVLVRNPASTTHLYRIAQEAVGNAIKHGGAREVRIILDESERSIRLVISDNGHGFSEPPPGNRGMGLRIMADRAKMIGGQLTIARNTGRGMELCCRIPRAATGMETDA